MGLNRTDIRVQAEQFLGYFSKLKDGELDEVFKFWAKSKDLDKETERAIRMEVEKILTQRRQG